MVSEVSVQGFADFVSFGPGTMQHLVRECGRRKCSVMKAGREEEQEGLGSLDITPIN